MSTGKAVVNPRITIGENAVIGAGSILAKSRNFNRALITLVAPIALQSVISTTVSSADVVILGTVSQSAMSTVSLAGQMGFVLLLFYLGLSTCAGILTAQYWGKKILKRYVAAICFHQYKWLKNITRELT